jgi:hypothetical protein
MERNNVKFSYIATTYSKFSTVLPTETVVGALIRQAGVQIQIFDICDGDALMIKNMVVIGSGELLS